MPSHTCEYPVNEKERLTALRRYDILDTPPDGTFDHLTQLAAYIFNVPIAIISLVDHDRIWFKSHFGLEVSQIDRAPGLCASAILSDDVYIVENAMSDPRTLTNPLVTGALGLRFYAAAPLHTMEGFNLGTFCVIDHKPRCFTEQQQRVLPTLAKVAVDEMELRLSLRRYLRNVNDDVRQAITALSRPTPAIDAVVSKLEAVSRGLSAKIDNSGPR